MNCRDNDLSKTEVTRLELNNDPTHTYTDKVTHPSSAKLEESDIQGRRDFSEEQPGTDEQQCLQDFVSKN